MLHCWIIYLHSFHIIGGLHFAFTVHLLPLACTSVFTSQITLQSSIRCITTSAAKVDESFHFFSHLQHKHKFLMYVVLKQITFHSSIKCITTSAAKGDESFHFFSHLQHKHKFLMYVVLKQTTVVASWGLGGAAASVSSHHHMRRQVT